MQLQAVCQMPPVIQSEVYILSRCLQHRQAVLARSLIRLAA